VPASDVNWLAHRSGELDGEWAAEFGDPFALAHQLDLGEPELVAAGEVGGQLVGEPGLSPRCS
jgi:hypothetical protein